MLACQPRESCGGNISALVIQSKRLWRVQSHIFEELTKQLREISKRKIVHTWDFKVTLVASGVYPIKNLRECEAICAPLNKILLNSFFLSEGHLGRYELGNVAARARVIKSNLLKLKQYVDSGAHLRMKPLFCDTTSFSSARFRANVKTEGEQFSIVR